MIHQFNTIQEIVDFVQRMDASVLKQMGLAIVRTNGEAVVQIGHEHLTPDLQAKLQSIEDKLGLKVQINKDAFDETHQYKILIKDDTPGGHVYAIDPVLTKTELDNIRDSLGRKVQITGTSTDLDDTYQVLAKNTSDGHVYLCPVTVTLREKQELAVKANQAYQHASDAANKVTGFQTQIDEVKTAVSLLGGSVPSSVMDEMQRLSVLPVKVNTLEQEVLQLTAKVGQTVGNNLDYMRLTPGEASGNYKFIVQQSDGTFHATDDWDYQVLQRIMNREIDNGDLISWIMSRPMPLGVITGTAANDLSGAPTERFSKHPIIEGDTISLKYPKGPSEPGKHYIQDFVWLDGSWQPKHI